MRRWLYRLKNEPYVTKLIALYIGERLFGPIPMRYARASDYLRKHVKQHNKDKRQHVKVRA